MATAEGLPKTKINELLQTLEHKLVGDLTIPTTPQDIGAQPVGDYATNPALTAEAQARQDADSALSDAIALRQTAEQVDARVQQVVGTAPAALDTLGEIAERLADDADAVAALTSAVADKADAGHNHDGIYAKPADLPDVSDVVREGDPRLTDARTPTAHSHAISGVTGLQDALDGKAATAHTHDDRYYTEGEVNTALAGKADDEHTHPVSDLTVTGTPDGTKFLRDDGAWATPEGGSSAPNFPLSLQTGKQRALGGGAANFAFSPGNGQFTFRITQFDFITPVTHIGLQVYSAAAAGTGQPFEVGVYNLFTGDLIFSITAPGSAMESQNNIWLAAPAGMEFPAAPVGFGVRPLGSPWAGAFARGSTTDAPIAHYTGGRNHWDDVTSAALASGALYFPVNDADPLPQNIVGMSAIATGYGAGMSYRGV